MQNRLLHYCLLITILWLTGTSCASRKHTTGQPTTTQTFLAQPPGSLPKAAREFRAAWVATVANINWPSRKDLTTEQQKQEAIALLDYLKANNFNAVIFQVRPQADALYQSSIEPWSYYLTGTQGQAPKPYYDPLQFWTEAAHDRGIELHVWINPYRAHHSVGGPVSDSSVVKKHPELVVKLKQGYYWFDPSLQGTKEHGYKVVMDIVKRYDIDGVHFDDYFYPYAEYNNGEDFPDSLSYAAYQQAGGKLSKGDWRRESVNDFIETLYKKIKAEKKHVKFGLSPFGVWRPGYPATIQGMDQYNVLYADAKLWLNKGWIDYFAPQLYWPINRIALSFPVLLGWWSQENTMGRHLWPGINIGTDTSTVNVHEVLSQIMITRGMQPQAPGTIHWSISQDVKNPNITSGLINGPYRSQALVPASPWLGQMVPATPTVQLSQLGNALKVSWTADSNAFHYVVYYKYKNNWSYKILNRQDRSTTIEIPIPASSAANPSTSSTILFPSYIAVTAVDRLGNESPFKEIENILTPLTPGVSIVPRAGWNAAPPKAFKPNNPTRITIHHEGTFFDSTKDAAKHIKNVQTWGMGPDRNWIDIPYHFLIAPDGTIYEGRNVHTVGETATEYDPSGHLLISLLGNFEVQEVPAKQLEALNRLIAWCCRQYNISPNTIASHKDHAVQTDCPGKNLYQYLQNGYIKTTVNQYLGAR